MTSKFPLGQTVVTQNALNTLSALEIADGLRRHHQGDWGNVPAEDAAANELALLHGDRLLSSYGEGPRRFWIITEYDRSVTTVLLPDDY